MGKVQEEVGGVEREGEEGKIGQWRVEQGRIERNGR